MWTIDNQDRADIFILNYAPKKQAHTGFDPATNKSTTWIRTKVPEALFFSKYSLDLGEANFYLIKPEYRYWFGTFGSVLFPELKIRNSTEFKVILESNGEIVTFEGIDIGEGMAKAKEIILSNGDTTEWTRFDFETFSNEGKILKSFIDIAIGKQARLFDFQRKCWFIQTDCIKPLLEGLKSLINQGTLSGYYITDNRETIEAFEDFFHKNEGAYQITPPKPKPILISEFCALLSSCSIQYSWLSSTTADEAKKYYRKAALALHPDRNNGDGSKMSELNKIWAELQEYL